MSGRNWIRWLERRGVSLVSVKQVVQLGPEEGRGGDRDRDMGSEGGVEVGKRDGRITGLVHWTRGSESL